MKRHRISLFTWILISGLMTSGWGCITEETENGSDIVIPETGDWEGSPISFTLGDSGIEKIRLNQFGCLGDVTPTGLALCDSILDSEWELPAPVMTDDGMFSIQTPFGLKLEGEFTDVHQMTGYYTYTSDNECCQSEGNWMTIHETIASESPPAVCHQKTGMESYSLLYEGGSEESRQVESGDKLDVSAGFQGGVMLVLELETENVNLGGGVEFNIELLALGSGITAQARANAIDLETIDGTTTIWDPVWLLLFSEEGDMLNLGDLNLIAGQNATLMLEVTNSCGYRHQSNIDVVLDFP